MKHKSIFIITFMFLLFPFANIYAKPVFAEEDISWCRITSENTYIYKENPSSNENSAYFKLPTTYFAQILESADEFYKISFDGIVGFVHKENVTKIYSVPLTPFPEDITFSINNSVQAVMRDYPSTSGQYVGVIPSGLKANFLGQTKGEEAISGLGTTWYFARFTNETETFCGFVYAPLVQNLKEIPENQEEVLLTPVSAKANESTVLSPELTNGKNILIIISLSFVGILLVLAIFIPIRKNKRIRKVLPPPKFDDMNF